MKTYDPIIHDLETMSRARNYNAWLFGQFVHYAGQRIFEVGAGAGNFTSLFLDRELIVAADFHEPCVNYLKKEFREAKNVIPLKMDVSSPETLDVKKYTPDTIICMNVLEHVENDEAALANMHAILITGGRLLLLVPAFQLAYGSIDRIVGHYRRYSKQDLKNKLQSAGFSILKLYYMNCLGLFGWVFNNRIIKLREESPEQVKFYDRAVVPWLSRIERVIRPPFGLSLVAVAVKRGE